MLETQRTRIDLVTTHDADTLRQYHLRNAAHLAPWEPTRPDGHHSIDAWQYRAAAYAANNRAGTSYHFAIRLADDNKIAGLLNFSNVVRGAFLACHLGYSVDQSQQGRGLMYDALSATIPAVFTTFGLHRIMANYMPANTRSGRLLTRLGFEKEGYARDYLKIAGAWQDHILMSRIST